VAPLEMVQRAAVVAWGDEAHVDAVRDTYRAKRDVVLPALERVGFRDAGGDATFFLWLEGGEELAARLLAAGVVVTPGSYFGAAGAGFVRLALVPSLADCERAVEMLGRL
jgi:acetylornithine aminotransferase